MKNVQINSKLVKKGDIFIAITCPELEENIGEAWSNGAIAVFAENSVDERVILVKDARLAASRLAKFRHCNQPELCIAITGTNGKSSVAHFLRQIWSYTGHTAASHGTLGLYVGNNAEQPANIAVPDLTTPDPVTLHRILEYLYENEVTHFVFEASSHALDQKRLHSVKLDAAAFTNLASDHLDYHKTQDAYLFAKLRLFKEILCNDRPAIASRDDPVIYEKIFKLNKNVVSFGFDSRNLIRAENIEVSQHKVMFDLIFGERKFDKTEINLVGKLQVTNILCAIALASSVGLNVEDIVSILQNIRPLTGRMEYVTQYNGGAIYVDFAHTSDGVKNALSNFKKLCAGNLICIFGCGGNRDREKRSEIGRIVDSLADILIVTDDNPRTENPEKIRKEIMTGCHNAVEIASRREAIRYGMAKMQKGDFLVILGKGHENFQIYGDEKMPFNDMEEVLKIAAINTL
ncbi:MAG: UDP-N-acetylmuramoyl-L-alanyl-D-glutamate--2,6-diaminopimelate ligase [Holosporales bacterium]|jgi:UDP-N-acetylmuramoyl-L-alanyl-D-glutamate--2,6-diaminopimelate ligase|nr:UDP-N-acetylmuramoyl-L-alanyl-D-glutamate--2,6-diaminopimelate ligase [Holosporales bacterium]